MKMIRVAVLLAGFSVWIFGCSGDSGPSGSSDFLTSAQQFAAVHDALIDYVSSVAPAILSASPELLLEIGDYTVLDIRSYSEFAAGHIPNAYNTSLSELLNDIEAQAFPLNEKLLVVDKSGQSAGHAVIALRALGYEAYQLRWGMSGWHTMMDHWSSHCGSGVPYETDANALASTYSWPIWDEEVTSEDEAVRSRVSKMLSEGFKGKSYADVVLDGLGSYFILNYFAYEDYDGDGDGEGQAPGHLIGAFQFTPRASLGMVEMLEYIPTDMPVLVYCWTGATSSQVAGYLNLLGYDAYSLKYGVNSLWYDELYSHKWDAEIIVDYPIDSSGTEHHLSPEFVIEYSNLMCDELLVDVLRYEQIEEWWELGPDMFGSWCELTWNGESWEGDCSHGIVIVTAYDVNGNITQDYHLTDDLRVQQTASDGLRGHGARDQAEVVWLFEDMLSDEPRGHASFIATITVSAGDEYYHGELTIHTTPEGLIINSDYSCPEGLFTMEVDAYEISGQLGIPPGYVSIDVMDGLDVILSDTFEMDCPLSEFSPVEDEIDQSGGEIHSGDYTLEIPAGALDGPATVTLDYADDGVADDFDGVFDTENTSILLSVTGANVVDEVYLEVPEFDEFSEYTVIGFESEGDWIPLTDYVSDGEIVRITLSPDRLGQGKRIWFGGNIFQLRFSALIGSSHVDPWLGQDPAQPVILFVHGACSNPDSWDEDVLDYFEDMVGDVWTLAYPWHDPFWDVLDDVVDEIEGQFDGREIYIVAHSKGGLLARALIRVLEERDVSIPKAVFLGTPHFGGLYGEMEEFAQVLLQLHYNGYPHLYSLLSQLIQEFPGLTELLPNSSALNALNTEADLINIPEYLCIVGDYNGSGGDGLVECISADLADPSHHGQHEEALFEEIDPVNYSHLDLNDWHTTNNYWIDVADFLGEESPPPPADFQLINAGSFLMGSPEDELGAILYEWPRHEVHLTRSYWMKSTEVTNQQYIEMAQWAYNMGHCTVRNDSIFDALDESTMLLFDMAGEGDVSFDNGIFNCIYPDRPVSLVSWFGAAAYCDWISMEEGLQRAYYHSHMYWEWSCNEGDPYSAVGYRLPTEAEWEYACRAGSTSAFSNGPIVQAYCGFEPFLSQIGWYCGSETEWPQPVAQKSPNAWGLYDMHGNVYEFCNDCYSDDYYENSPSVDPVGPVSGGMIVVRGGSWTSNSKYCRSAHRYWSNRPACYSEFGFRPVRSQVTE